MPAENKDHLNYILKTTISKTSKKSIQKRQLAAQMKQYEVYKNNFVKDIVFDPNEIGLSMFICPAESWFHPPSL